jgi:hypothetical protein
VIPAVLERILEWLVWTPEKNIEISEKWEDFFLTHGVHPQLFEYFKDNASLSFESIKDARELITTGAGEVSQALGANDLLKKIFEE